MKQSLTLLLICIAFNVFASVPPQTNTSLYRHLVDVNPEWEKYIAEKDNYASLVSFASEDELLQQHFRSVIAYLKKNRPDNLSFKQKHKRKKLLRVLENYWKAKKFPRNFDYKFEKKSCFIDEKGGVCAVGNLLIKDGNKSLAYFIAREMKYYRVMEMNNDELIRWQQQSGFTLEELALIQPSYGYTTTSTTIITPNFGMDIFGLNSAKNNSGATLCEFSGVYNWQTGITLTVMKQKGLSITTGINYKRYMLKERIESNFEPLVYGVIKSDMSINYITIPVLLGRSSLGGSNLRRSDFRKENYSGFKFGLVSAFYRSYKQTAEIYGSATNDDAGSYSVRKKEVAHYIPILYTCYSTEIKLMRVKNGTIRLHLEPNLSYGVRKTVDQSYNNGYRPLNIGLNTGLSWVHVEKTRNGMKF